MVKKDIYTKEDYKKGGTIIVWLIVTALMIADLMHAAMSAPIGWALAIPTIISFILMCVGRGRWMIFTTGVLLVVFAALGMIAGATIYGTTPMLMVTMLGAITEGGYGVYTIVLCQTKHVKRYFTCHKLIDEMEDE